MRDFQIIFAITIAIKNHSGKIRDRFSIQIRSAILIAKTGSRFESYFKKILLPDDRKPPSCATSPPAEDGAQLR
jgi:hypothetical protein